MNTLPRYEVVLSPEQPFSFSNYELGGLTALAFVHDLARRVSEVLIPWATTRQNSEYSEPTVVVDLIANFPTLWSVLLYNHSKFALFSPSLGRPQVEVMTADMVRPYPRPADGSYPTKVYIPIEVSKGKKPTKNRLLIGKVVVR